jgi:hypothetical protein
MEIAMPNLPLAVDIADLVADAPARHGSTEARRIAAELSKDHPEAEATQSDIVQVLLEEEHVEFAD